MATVAIDENVIKLTSETLGKVIKQVPLTEKLLSRPPFKFIHDIIKEIIRNNGFLAGLYTDDELSSENIKNKEAKIEFLQKTIDALGFITNAPLNNVKANKIVAGLEPEHTNELLQTLGKCVISRKSHEVAVKRVLNGEKPGPSTALSVDEVADSPPKKSSAPKTGGNGEQRKPVQSKATTSSKPASTTSSKPTNTSKSTTKSSGTSQTKPKTPTKTTTTTTSAPKRSTPAATRTTATPKAPANSTTRSNQPTKVSSSKPITPKGTSQATKRGQERIAKPVAKLATTKAAGKANLVNQAANERTVASRAAAAAAEPKSAIAKSRTLTGEELSAVRANKQANRAEAENEAANSSETNLEATPATNLDDEVDEQAADDAEQRSGENEQRQRENDETATTNGSSAISNLKSARPAVDRTSKQPAKVEDSTSNEISSRSARRPIVSSMQADRQPAHDRANKEAEKRTNGPVNQRDSNDEESAKVPRPTTASRPLTARAAPPRAVSRRALREERQTNNVLEMASLARPQTSVKQVLVTNLIKESNDGGDSLDDDDEDLEGSQADKLSRRTLTANTEHSLLKDNIRKLDEQNDDFLTGRNQFNRELDDDPEKGSLVKKLIKSKLDLEGGAEHQAQPSSATLVRSNRDIERLKEHIQTLSKLANPLSKLLDNLQEDVDLMLLEERNWLDEQQRNEQQLLALREQMDEELKSVHLQIANLDDQIEQERDVILVTNVNLLINQAKLEDIVRKMIEN